MPLVAIFYFVGEVHDIVVLDAALSRLSTREHPLPAPDMFRPHHLRITDDVPHSIPHSVVEIHLDVVKLIFVIGFGVK